MDFSTYSRLKYWHIFVLSAIIILLFAGGGLLFFNYSANEIRTEKHNDLSTIAEVKYNQLKAWRAERMADALLLSKSPFFITSLQRFIGADQDTKLRSEIAERLTLTVDYDHYRNVVLIRPDLKNLISVDESRTSLSAYQQQKIHEAIHLGEAMFTDLYLSGQDSLPQMDLIAPVYTANNSLLAILIFQIDPEEYLYPLLKDWPVPSQTSEVLLVRKEGDRVVFLNELRHNNEKALHFSLPVSRTDMPAVQAVNGKTGIVSGNDYRGVPVIADIRPINGTSWFMVAKIDEQEAFQELHFRTLVIVLFVLSLLILSSVVVMMYIYSRQRNVYKELYANEKKLREEHQEFRTTLYSIGDAVITTDTRGYVREMNPVAEKLTGWTEAEAAGQPLDKVFVIINEETRRPVTNPASIVLAKGIIVGLANHTLLISRQGNEIPIADSGAPIINEENEICGVVLVFRDQTEERTAEAALTESEERFRSLFRNMAEGVALHELVFGENDVPVDYVIVNCNHAYENIFGIEKTDILSKPASTIPGWIQAKYLKEYANVAISGAPLTFELHDTEKDKHFVISVATWGRAGFATIVTDITERIKYAEALWSQQQRMALHVEQTPIAVIEWDASFCVTEWNAAAEHMFGYSREEARGRHINSLLIPPEFHKDIDNLHKEILCYKQSRQGINKNLTRSGKRITIEWIITPLVDAHGTVLGFTSLCEDISSRIAHEEALRESEERFRRIFEESADPILLLNDSHFFDCNPTTLRKLGYTSREDIIGKTPAELSPEYQPDGQLSSEKAKEVIAAAKKRGFNCFEWAHTTASGEMIIFEVMLTPFKLHGETIYHVMWRDITERRMLMSQLIEAKEKAEEMTRIKSNFFANMSHELRTPLIGILGYSEVLQDRLIGQDELNKMAATINMGGTRLLETLNLILNISKIEASKVDITMQPVNICRILSETHTLYASAAEKKGLQFDFTTVEENIYCDLDEKLFRDILHNLVNNAVKYTERGRIWIAVKKTPHDAVIEFGDTGIGIAKEKQSVIWEEFRQVSEGFGRSFEGSGLGLTLTKKYINLLGGTIALLSEEKKGSLFTVTFPLIQKSALHPTDLDLIDDAIESIPATEDIEHNRLLFVEDDHISREIVSMMLQDRFILDIVTDAEEALVQVMKHKYDAVLMDINLGKDIDGVELTRRIKRLPGYQDIPYIAVTAYAMSTEREEFLSKGLTHYLSKPFSRAQLIQVLVDALSTKVSE
ncbi:MAG: PAS domain S-box protein [Ignavibacteria bacterium]|nr:PAS domain S-box protein [Ignavibacteria bacterium]